MTFRNQHHNNTKNMNYHDGEVPAGVYGNDTKFEFCCSNDVSGNSRSVIVLPIDKPFFLMQSRHASQCQAVRGALHRLEVITYDTHNEKLSNWPRGEYPKGLTELPNPKINFCYYRGEEN